MSKYVSDIIPLYLGNIVSKRNKEFLPVYSFLIIKDDKKILYDTGFSFKVYTQGTEVLGGLKYLISMDTSGHSNLEERLGEMGIKLDEIDYVVYSHLHFDHCGEVERFAEKSQIIIQEAEMEACLKCNNSFEYLSEHFKEIKDKIKTISGDYDLFGDESVKILFTPGHSMGHQSLLLRAKQKCVLLLGDFEYLTNKKSIGMIRNMEKHLESIAKIDKMAGKYFDVKDAIYSHDKRCMAEKSLLV